MPHPADRRKPPLEFDTTNPVQVPAWHDSNKHYIKRDQLQPPLPPPPKGATFTAAEILAPVVTPPPPSPSQRTACPMCVLHGAFWSRRGETGWFGVWAHVLLSGGNCWAQPGPGASASGRESQRGARISLSSRPQETGTLRYFHPTARQSLVQSARDAERAVRDERRRDQGGDTTSHRNSISRGYTERSLNATARSAEGRSETGSMRGSRAGRGGGDAAKAPPPEITIAQVTGSFP